jgi:hypothetical protein
MPESQLDPGRAGSGRLKTEIAPSEEDRSRTISCRVRKKVAERTIKHVGLPESVGLIALAMGWKVGGIQERITPIVAETPVSSDYIKVPAGSVARVRQVAKGILAGQELVGHAYNIVTNKKDESHYRFSFMNSDDSQ